MVAPEAVGHLEVGKIKTMKYLTLILYLVFTGFLSAQDIPAKPNPARFVNDYAGLLPDTVSRRLEMELSDFAKKTTNRVVLATVKSLGGYAIEDYSLKWAQSWGIGQKGQDNGVLLLIAVDDRKMRIEVGYGLEATLTDSKSAAILDDIRTDFKNKDFASGLRRASYNIIKQISPNHVTATDLPDLQAAPPAQSNKIYTEKLPKKPISIVGITDLDTVLSAAQKSRLSAQLAELNKKHKLCVRIFLIRDADKYAEQKGIGSFYAVAYGIRDYWELSNYNDDSTIICFVEASKAQYHRNVVIMHTYKVLPSALPHDTIYAYGLQLGKYIDKDQYEEGLAMLNESIVPFIARHKKKYDSAKFWDNAMPFIIVFGIMFIVILLAFFLPSGKGGGSSSYSSGGGGSSSYSDSSSSYSDSSSSYSDYGGGSFGGGGATGSW